MRVIAVIPAWNARSRLPGALDALAGQVERTIVVDNASADGTAEWLAAAWPEVLIVANGENLGFTTAANQGMRRAFDLGAEAVLLVNDDLVFEPGAVAALVAALAADPAAGAATAKTRYPDRPSILNGTGGRFDPSRAWAALRGEGEPDAGQYDLAPTADYPSGAASLLRREAWSQVGGFDEAYFLYYEDVDWGLRAAELGWRTRFAPAALAAHAGSSGTATDPARRTYYNVRNRLRLARRHASVRGRAWAWLATLARLAKQPARWLSVRRRRDAEAVAWAVVDHLAGRYGRSARYG